MKVLLVKPYSDFPTRIPPLGLGYLASALRAAGHEPRVLDCPRQGLDRDAVAETLAGWQPGVVGFQTFTADLPVIRELCADARRLLPGAVLVLGGPHPSCLPEHCFRFIPEIDYAFLGEAERSLVRLVDDLAAGRPDPAAVPGLAWREGDKVRANPPAWEKDLDALGRPAWDLIPPDRKNLSPHGAFVRRLPVAPLVTTRGCPFPCTFCAARRISGKPVRKRSVEDILGEIRHLKETYGVREIHVEDDNFTFHRDFAEAFCQGLLDARLDVTWCCPNGIRLDTLDEALVRLMRRSGCYSVAVGIESGSDRVLRLIRKQLDTREIRERLGLLHRAGIKTTGFFIIGLPGETEAEILETVRFAKSLPLDRAQFSTYLPLPGTDDFDAWIAGRDLDTVDWKQFYTTEVVYAPEGITLARMATLQSKAFLSFYLRPRILWGILREVRSPRHFFHLLGRAAAVFRR